MSGMLKFVTVRKRNREETNEEGEQQLSQPTKVQCVGPTPSPRTPQKSKHKVGFNENWLKKYKWLSYEKLESGDEGRPLPVLVVKTKL